MRVGIIGGGSAGLCAAWLLDGYAQVTVLEQQSQLGGHAHTVYVQVDGTQVPVELGFEFFNEKMFPTLCRLLKVLPIHTTTQPFTYSYRTNSNELILPPIQGFNIFFSSFTIGNIKHFIALKQVIEKSRIILEQKDTTISLEQLLHGYSESFIHEFFLPLFCAGWGVTPEEFKTFAAYNVMSWIVQNKPMGLGASYWSEIPTGISGYINALIKQLKQVATKPNCTVTTITHHDNVYKVQINNGTTLEFDHLIIATNAIQARQLIQSVSIAQELIPILSMVDYLTAQLAVHSDQRFMPPKRSHWSIANVWKHGAYSALTTYKPHGSTTPLFRSWLLPGFPTPNKIYEQATYYHAKPTVAYFKAQQLLAAQQGKNNLWFAGIYTHDIDSHESALVSALKIVQRIMPNSVRLQQLI